VRFAAAISKVVLWLATTAALAVAIPAGWVQTNVIDADGYAAMAQKAAGDPVLQSAVASELTTKAMALIAARGGGRYPVDSSQVHDAATVFIASPSFPPLFAQANRAAHGWLFTAPQSGQNGNQWLVDVAPMLKDPALQQLLSSYRVKLPASLTVPLTVSVPSGSSGPQPLRQGQLNRLATWGPWVSIGAMALSGVCALLTLLAARRRGKALTSLGVSALIVGASGWAAIEVGGRYIDVALNRTTGDIREMADVMVGQAEASLHQWLDLALVAGVALVVFGVLVAVLGSLRE
jgi:predicted lipoprotein with Yx(FWY)xxD motif